MNQKATSKIVQVWETGKYSIQQQPQKAKLYYNKNFTSVALYSSQGMVCTEHSHLLFSLTLCINRRRAASPLNNKLPSIID